MFSRVFCVFTCFLGFHVFERKLTKLTKSSQKPVSPVPPVPSEQNIHIDICIKGVVDYGVQMRITIKDTVRCLSQNLGLGTF